MVIKKLAERGGILIGDISEKAGERATIHVWKVPPEQRRKGIGTWLIDQFEHMARKAGASGIQMLVSSDHIAKQDRPVVIRFLERRHYQRNMLLPPGIDPIYFLPFRKRRKRK